MKKIIALVLAAALAACTALAETVLDYALWLEQALPGANFTQAQVPEFVNEHLGADYDFIARTDETYGGYIAGVRRADAPVLPDDVRRSSYSGTFETRVFRAEDDDGNVYYDFVLADGVDMYAYDGLEHLIILIAQENITPNAHILRAAEPMRRAQLFYGAEHGFSQLGSDRNSQLVFPVHNLESWQAGATDQPTRFHLDISLPENILGGEYLEEDDLIQHTRIPPGASAAG